MTSQAPSIINGLVFLPPPPQRVSEHLRDRLMKEMREDIYGPPRNQGIENAVSSICEIIDQRAEALELAKANKNETPAYCMRLVGDAPPALDSDVLTSWLSQIPNEDTRRILSDRVAAIRDDRPKRRSPRRPQWLVFLIDVAITQWHAETGRLPSAMDDHVYKSAGIEAIGAKLFGTLRGMLLEVSPADAKLLTPDLYLSRLRKYRLRVEFTVLGRSPPAQRPRGRPRKKLN